MNFVSADVIVNRQATVRYRSVSSSSKLQS